MSASPEYSKEKYKQELREKAESLLAGIPVCYNWLRKDIEDILKKVVKMLSNEDCEERERGWFVCDSGKGVELVPYVEGDVNYDSVWMKYKAPTKELALQKYLTSLYVTHKERISEIQRIESTIKDVKLLLEREFYHDVYGDKN